MNNERTSMTEFQRRRFWRAWLPLAFLSAIFGLVSLFFTDFRVNGLTMWLIFSSSVFLGLMVWESRDT